MNPKTKEVLFVCAAIVIGSYLVRSFVASYQRIVYARQQAMRRAQQPKPVPVSKAPDPAETALATEAAAMGNLSGMWEGRGPTPSRGICNLHLELKQGDPGQYKGYSRFNCIQLQSMEKPTDPSPIFNMAQNITPQAAVLTGRVEKGTIHLHTAKAIGTDGNGCSITELILTPFGATRVAAEWKEGTCQGGNLMMQRAAR